LEACEGIERVEEEEYVDVVIDDGGEYVAIAMVTRIGNWDLEAFELMVV
jgi:hypothetical protein